MVRLLTVQALALSVFSSFVRAETITVTTKICPTASHAQRTTTVLSTVQVYPTAISDEDVNSGTPIIVRLELTNPSGYQKRQAGYGAPSWLMPNGNTTTNLARAAQYKILDGQLVLSNGSHVSADAGTSVQSFAISSHVGAINSGFSSINNSLVWKNDEFTTGFAQFYKLPANLLDNARVLAKLTGPAEPERGWSAVKLAPQPAAYVYQQTSLAGYASAQSSSSSPSNGYPSHGPVYDGPSYVAPSASATGSSSSPSSSQVIPDGACGSPSGRTCYSSPSGSCCSAYGFCGSSADYCGTGCQSAFGNCNSVPGSSSSTSHTGSSSQMSSVGHITSVSPPVVVPSSTAATSSSSVNGYQSISPTAAACPEDSNTTFTDNNGIQYRIGCGYDASPVSYQAVPIGQGYDFNQCFYACDSSTGCRGFSFTGSPNGAGPGSCYLKSDNVELQPGNPNLVAAVRVTPGSGIDGYGGVSSVSTTFHATTSSVHVNASMTGLYTATIPTSTAGSYSGDDGDDNGSDSGDDDDSGDYGDDGDDSGNDYGNDSGDSYGEYSSTRRMSSTSSSSNFVAYTAGASTTGLTSSSSIVEHTAATTTTSHTSSSSFTAASQTPYTEDSTKCPATNNQIITDSDGNGYKVLCSTDSDGVSYRTYQVQNGGMVACLDQCAMDSNCAGVSYSSDSTEENGFCYLKTSMGANYAVTTNVQIGIRQGGTTYVATSTSIPSTSAASLTSTAAHSTIISGYTGVPTATRCFPAGRTASDDLDDEFCEISLPFDMKMYGQTTRSIFANANGLLTFDAGSNDYDAEALPDYSLSGLVLEPFFDDFYTFHDRTADTTQALPNLDTGLPQGLYYTLSPSQSPTDVNVTYVLSRAGSYERYQFSVLYSSLHPNVVTYEYYVTGGPGSGTSGGGGTSDTSSNDGSTESVGLQLTNADASVTYVQWEFQTAGSVVPGMKIVCDTSITPAKCTGSNGVVVTGMTASAAY